MKRLSLLIGFVSLFLGIYLFNQPFAAVGAIAWILALIIFLSGLNQLRFYFYLPEEHRPLLLLIRAIGSSLVGFVLLTSSAFFRSNLILSVLSVWLLILGVSRLMMRSNLPQNQNDRRQTWGILGVGLLLFIAPVFSSVFIGKFFSLIFIMIGLSTLFFGKRF